MKKAKALFFLAMFITGCLSAQRQPAFVRCKGQEFMLGDKPYHYIGTNYWYGGLLGLTKEGTQRLKKELDFLKANGVINLRVMAGVEGSGNINGVQRVNRAFQPSQGVFNQELLTGLDVLVSEMKKRDMKAVIFLSNNWEWTGGFLQYLNWNGLIADSVLRRKLNWDELRDYTSKFYTCDSCMAAYSRQVHLVVTRKNKITGVAYINDPTIMSWELANEPRPMRSAANKAYKKWIKAAADNIKQQDPNHLVTIGHEGDQATDGDMSLYEAIHANTAVDYLTVHIWPKNWGWLNPETMSADMPVVLANTAKYIKRHEAAAARLKKPLVVEEFGLPRNDHSFSPSASVDLRNMFYKLILDAWNAKGVAGLNFWAFGGTGRPVPGQVFWKEGDDYLGDPPMEEQGLNTVFDSDTATWLLIRSYLKP